MLRKVSAGKRSELKIELSEDEQYGKGILSKDVLEKVNHSYLDPRFASKHGDKLSGWFFYPGFAKAELASKYGVKDCSEEYLNGVAQRIEDVYSREAVPAKWKKYVHYTTYDADNYEDDFVTTYEFEFDEIPESELAQMLDDMQESLDVIERNESTMKKIFSNKGSSVSAATHDFRSRIAHAAKEKSFQDQLNKIAEDNQWNVKIEGNDVEFSKYSPAGEDFYFTLTLKALNMHALEDAMYDYIMSYDPEEEASYWCDEEGNGRDGAPDKEALIEDKEAILGDIKELEKDVLAAMKKEHTIDGGARRVRANSFKRVPSLSNEEYESVFFGDLHDPRTLEANMDDWGFKPVEGYPDVFGCEVDNQSRTGFCAFVRVRGDSIFIGCSMRPINVFYGNIDYELEFPDSLNNRDRFDSNMKQYACGLVKKLQEIGRFL